MTRPRSFGARPTKQEQLGRVRGIGEAANALDAPTNPDAGDMRLLPMDEVRVDPNNPRRLNLTWELLQAPFEDLEPASVRNEVETIHGLAQTFRQVGQRSPIEVVRDGTLKRIVFGERRYWAARVAGLAYIKAIVLRRAPENIALVQLIENIQHKQMPLYETVLNLRSVIERESELGSPVLDATDLMDRTGLTRATAYRYWKYMDLPEDVEMLLANGTLRTHEELGSILKHATPAEREAALARYLGGGSLGARLSGIRHPADTASARAPENHHLLRLDEEPPSGASSLPDPRSRQRLRGVRLERRGGGQQGVAGAARRSRDPTSDGMTVLPERKPGGGRAPPPGPRAARKTKIALRVPPALSDEVDGAMTRDGYSRKRKSLWVEEALFSVQSHDRDLRQSLVGDRAQGRNTRQMIIALSPEAHDVLKDLIIRLRLQIPTIEGVQSLVPSLRDALQDPKSGTLRSLERTQPVARFRQSGYLKK